MRANDYKILVQAVEDGVARGISRYYKYRDDYPGEETCLAMAQTVADGVLNSICEWFHFEELRDA